MANVSGDEGEKPTTTLALDGIRTDNHQALGEPPDDEALHDTSGDEAMGLAIGGETESDGDMGTADVNSSEGNDHGINRTAAHHSADDDAVAIQRAPCTDEPIEPGCALYISARQG